MSISKSCGDFSDPSVYPSTSTVVPGCYKNKASAAATVWRKIGSCALPGRQYYRFINADVSNGNPWQGQRDIARNAQCPSEPVPIRWKTAQVPGRHKLPNSQLTNRAAREAARFFCKHASSTLPLPCSLTRPARSGAQFPRKKTVQFPNRPLQIVSGLVVAAIQLVALDAFAQVTTSGNLPPGVVAAQNGQQVTLQDMDAYASKIPEKDRAGFFDSPKRIESSIRSILLQKQLAAEARAKLDKDATVQRQILMAYRRHTRRRAARAPLHALKMPDFAPLAQGITPHTRTNSTCPARCRSSTFWYPARAQ